ncbi:hypothetical protein GIB67_009176 [Kingdonia uniflora]|uniref:RRM domain-containing protein n=1 Tax=Kingdonia uniflora TaxID=39325 RepID=A0A7J7N267_9MAGN|nr:hypothetical protein GIB67_009176 [Kingdonia uniflora]
MNVVFIRKRVHGKKAKNDDKGKLVLYSLHSSMEDMKSSINPVKSAFIIREEVMMVKGYSEHFLCNAWYNMMHDPVALQLFMAGDAKDKKMVLERYHNLRYTHREREKRMQTSAANGGVDAQLQQQQAMMMQQHYPQQYMYAQQQHILQPQQQQQALVGGGSSGGDENKTIWVDDLQYWMDESYLNSCFGHTNQVFNIKVKGEQKVAKTTIFVGDLGSDVTDAILQETFDSKFPSVKGAKVVIDATNDRSKGYGFVRFGDDNERSQALTEMNGAYCSNRPMHINVATPRKPSEYQQQSQAVVLGGEYGSNGASSQNFLTDEDSNNTTIFVGGLDASIIDEDLRRQFSQFSKIFDTKSNAEEALQGSNGTTIGKNTVRLSWGRSPVNKQPRPNNGNQWNGRGAYYGGQTYDGSYGYATPVSQDPNMYAAAATAYGAYPTYGNNQQQVS